MKQSDLQFSNPRIEKIDFRVNNNIGNSDNIPICIEVETNATIDCQEAIVKLNLIVGEINEESGEVVTSMYFNGIIVADFSWNDNIENAETMLKISGGTVLLSYIRPILANLTLQAGMKPLNLPFINFTQNN